LTTKKVPGTLGVLGIFLLTRELKMTEDWLDGEVVVEYEKADGVPKRSDDPSSTKESRGDNFGQSGVHIIQIQKLPKSVPWGEPMNGWQMMKDSDTEFEWEVDAIAHHATCDELPYGVECALDAHLAHDGWRELLESSQFLPPFTDTPEGFWKVWVCWEKSFVDSYHHYGWEYDQYLDFERLDEAEAQNYV
jgi:hypothetical protein